MPLSASRLEKLAKCPRAYFYEYVLDLVPPDEARREDQWLNPREFGNLLHETLYDFMAGLRAEGLRLDPARDGARLKAAAGRRLARWKEIVPPPNLAAFRAQEDELLAACDIFLRNEESNEARRGSSRCRSASRARSATSRSARPTRRDRDAGRVVPSAGPDRPHRRGRARPLHGLGLQVRQRLRVQGGGPRLAPAERRPAPAARALPAGRGAAPRASRDAGRRRHLRLLPDDAEGTDAALPHGRARSPPWTGRSTTSSRSSRSGSFPHTADACDCRFCAFRAICGNVARGPARAAAKRDAAEEDARLEPVRSILRRDV